jgi:hypothetical protein
MPRLFIFAIGGTGSRVLRSLTMLLATGVKPAGGRDYEIVPVIIDPHKGNEDLKRTERLLKNYRSIIREAGTGNGFFGTKMATLEDIVPSENRARGSFTFGLQQVSNTRFKEYIGLDQLSPPSKALAEILFSGSSVNKHHDEVDLLDVEMDIGFVGNPNIGSVVLNQFKDSEEFREIGSNFKDGDRIFIISSIFGGTGAAGFPVILKNIRGAMDNPGIDGAGFLRNAPIGALSVMPYFNVEKDTESPIQRADFIAKTKAALHYYKDNVTGNNSVNALYYIADDHIGKPYKNDPGDGGQRNDAHFVELASAIAVIDFLSIPDAELKCEEGKAVDPVYKEFGIRKDTGEVTFSELEDETERLISLRLSQFALFRMFVNEHLSEAISKQPWSISVPELNMQFFNNTFHRTHVSEFLNAYGDWLKEMTSNQRSFSPFNLIAEIPALVKGRKANSPWHKKKVDENLVNEELTKAAKDIAFPNAEGKLIRIFHDATARILTGRFGMKAPQA